MGDQTLEKADRRCQKDQRHSNRCASRGLAILAGLLSLVPTGALAISGVAYRSSLAEAAAVSTTGAEGSCEPFSPPPHVAMTPASDAAPLQDLVLEPVSDEPWMLRRADGSTVPLRLDAGERLEIHSSGRGRGRGWRAQLWRQSLLVERPDATVHRFEPLRASGGETNVSVRLWVFVEGWDGFGNRWTAQSTSRSQSQRDAFTAACCPVNPNVPSIAALSLFRPR